MVTKRRKNILVSYLILLITTSLSSCISQETEHIHHITLEDLKKDVIGKDVQLIDVRTTSEYNAGHIDDAININYFEKELFLDRISKLDKNKPIYLYCHIGGRSGKASKTLEKQGFKTIYDFTGGWKSWQKGLNKVKEIKKE